MGAQTFFLLNFLLFLPAAPPPTTVDNDSIIKVFSSWFDAKS